MSGVEGAPPTPAGTRAAVAHAVLEVEVGPLDVAHDHVAHVVPAGHALGRTSTERKIGELGEPLAAARELAAA